MPLPPPKCPTPDCDDPLWRDTTTTEVHWDNWRWWCHRCDKKWYPTREQIEEFRHAVGAGVAARAGAGAGVAAGAGAGAGARGRAHAVARRDPRAHHI
ncbi:hypothetical protein [Streptomyces sp. GS7]|uniref:hypothetical protein n=1 Tax=Streptomyces sp. GS7 TaxID=2692234 RepID=UPI001316EAE1|nr:hypothetical protein [Streptomyces sp. GS7]QHC25827.1 hypothetical protein GR130_35045 [Streptomyces sp. GS7]